MIKGNEINFDVSNHESPKYIFNNYLKLNYLFKPEIAYEINNLSYTKTIIKPNLDKINNNICKINENEIEIYKKINTDNYILKDIIFIRDIMVMEIAVSVH